MVGWTEEQRRVCGAGAGARRNGLSLWHISSCVDYNCVLHCAVARHGGCTGSDLWVCCWECSLTQAKCWNLPTQPCLSSKLVLGRLGVLARLARASHSHTAYRRTAAIGTRASLPVLLSVDDWVFRTGSFCNDHSRITASQSLDVTATSSFEPCSLEQCF